MSNVFETGLANAATVFVGTAILGLSCGALGSVVVLRGRTLIGDALAHATLPGIAGAYLITGERNFIALVIGAFISSALAGIFMSVIRLFTPLKEDTCLSVTLGTFFAAGIMLLDYAQRQTAGDKAGLKTFIFGHAAGMLQGDIVTIVLVSIVVFTFLLLLSKELALLCFDPSFLAVLGYPVFVIDALLMVVITMVIIAGLPAVGAILVTSLLFIPAISAQLLSDQIRLIVPLAALFGMLSALLGTWLSVSVDIFGRSSAGFPTGPAIVVVASLMCVLSGALARAFSRSTAS